MRVLACTIYLIGCFLGGCKGSEQTKAIESSIVAPNKIGTEKDSTSTVNSDPDDLKNLDTPSPIDEPGPSILEDALLNPFINHRNLVALTYYVHCAVSFGRVKCYGWRDREVSKPPHDLRKVKLLHAIDDAICAIHGAGFTCWGREAPSYPGFNIFDAKKIVTLDPNVICAISDTDFGCWEDGKAQRLAIPFEVDRPIDLQVSPATEGHRNLCLLGKNGLQCAMTRFNSVDKLGPIKKELKGQPERATQFSMNWDKICYVYDNKLNCGNYPVKHEYSYVSKKHEYVKHADELVTPQIDSPTQVIMYKNTICAATTGDAVCWPEYIKKSSTIGEIPARLKNIKFWFVAFNDLCGIVDSKTQCFGKDKMPGTNDFETDRYPSYFPSKAIPVPQHYQIFDYSSRDRTCYVEDSRLVCWAYYEKGSKSDHNADSLLSPPPYLWIEHPEWSEGKYLIAKKNNQGEPEMEFIFYTYEDKNNKSVENTIYYKGSFIADTDNNTNEYQIRFYDSLSGAVFGDWKTLRAWEQSELNINLSLGWVNGPSMKDTLRHLKLQVKAHPYWIGKEIQEIDLGSLCDTHPQLFAKGLMSNYGCE